MQKVRLLLCLSFCLLLILEKYVVSEIQPMLFQIQFLISRSGRLKQRARIVCPAFFHAFIQSPTYTEGKE